MLYTPLFIISHLTVLPALVIARCALLRRRHTCLRLGSIMSEQATRDSEEEDSDYVQGENRSVRHEWMDFPQSLSFSGPLPG